LFGLLGQALQYGQGEPCRLAGAGLCRREQVASGKNQWNGLSLNGRGRGVTLLGNSTEQFGRKAEIFERRCNVNLPRSAWEDRVFRRFRLIIFFSSIRAPGWLREVR
jgi:hypothetical protein